MDFNIPNLFIGRNRYKNLYILTEIQVGSVKIFWTCSKDWKNIYWSIRESQKRIGWKGPPEVVQPSLLRGARLVRAGSSEPHVQWGFHCLQEQTLHSTSAPPAPVVSTLTVTKLFRISSWIFPSCSLCPSLCSSKESLKSDSIFFFCTILLGCSREIAISISLSLL